MRGVCTTTRSLPPSPSPRPDAESSATPPVSPRSSAVSHSIHLALHFGPLVRSHPRARPRRRRRRSRSCSDCGTSKEPRCRSAGTASSCGAPCVWWSGCRCPRSRTPRPAWHGKESPSSLWICAHFYSRLQRRPRVRGFYWGLRRPKVVFGECYHATRCVRERSQVRTRMRHKRANNTHPSRSAVARILNTRSTNKQPAVALIARTPRFPALFR